MSAVLDCCESEPAAGGPESRPAEWGRAKPEDKKATSFKDG